jgi:transposase
VRFILTAGQAYDADSIVEAVGKMGAPVVIPPKSNRKTRREYGATLHRERNHIERLFNKLKRFRRVATRYDKTAPSFMAFRHLAAAYLRLK